MSGDQSFQILALATLSLFTAAFCSVYFYDRRQVFAGWSGLAYFTVLISYSLDSIRGFISSLTLIAFGTALFWIFCLCIIQAISLRARRKFPAILTSAICIAGAILFVATSQDAEDITFRSIVVTTVGATLLAITVPILHENRKSPVDNVLMVIMITIPLMMMTRTVWIFGIVGERLTSSGYAASNYAWIFHFTSALSAIALGMGLLLAMGHDMVARYRGETRLDPLTGLFNLRGLREKFAGHLASHQQSPTYHFLMQFDLDNFKRVNDCCGHVAGDAVLRHVAKTLDVVMRDWGVVGRSGGEEFTILLTVSDPKAVRLAAEHLRLALQMIEHSECPAHSNVTASFGIARIQDAIDFDGARELADRALYKAKNNGRNRIEYAGNFAGLSVAA